jgi:hypothetical protein
VHALVQQDTKNIWKNRNESLRAGTLQNDERVFSSESDSSWSERTRAIHHTLALPPCALLDGLKNELVGLDVIANILPVAA